MYCTLVNSYNRESSHFRIRYKKDSEPGAPLIGHLCRNGDEIGLSFLIPDEKHWSRWRKQVHELVDQWLVDAGDIEAGWQQLMLVAQMEPVKNQQVLLEYCAVPADEAQLTGAVVAEGEVKEKPSKTSHLVWLVSLMLLLLILQDYAN